MRHNIVSVTRRQVLRLGILGGISAFISACAGMVRPLATSFNSGASAEQSPKSPAAVATSPAQAPTVAASAVPVTPIFSFYTVAYRDDEPPEAPNDWKLSIGGSVGKPVSLSLDEIRALPSVTEMRTLCCISNPIGGDLISNAVWKGVRLQNLLQTAGVTGGATHLKLESFDGYSTGIPLPLAMDEHSLLAYEMNGVSLPAIHGGPLRCLWPGRYGMKQPKWIQKITLVNSDYIGFWESQGWSNDAVIQPFARIDAPDDLAQVSTSTFTLKGIAFAGSSGLAKVQIVWDDSNQWREAELARGPSPYTWSIWEWSGPALALGRHTSYVRATDNSGLSQTWPQASNLLNGTYPNGTTDMHSITLDFK